MSVSKIARFLGIPNNQVTLLTNPGGGHCLFYSIAQAMRSVNQKSANGSLFDDVTVLRAYVAQGLTAEHYDTIKGLFDELTVVYQKATMNGDRQLARDTASSLDQLSYIKNCKCLADLKRVVLTSKFWGDETSVQILQKRLGVGMLILTDTVYDMVELSFLEPDVLRGCHSFIILSLSGCHYELVTVGYPKSMPMFRANNLPDSIQRELNDRVFAPSQKPALKPDKLKCSLKKSTMLQSPVAVLRRTLVSKMAPSVQNRTAKKHMDHQISIGASRPGKVVSKVARAASVVTSTKYIAPSGANKSLAQQFSAVSTARTIRTVQVREAVKTTKQVRSIPQRIPPNTSSIMRKLPVRRRM